MTDGLLALALGAGMVAAINQCGFALLPAYLSLLVIGDSTDGRRSAVGRALALTGAMTWGSWPCSESSVWWSRRSPPVCSATSHFSPLCSAASYCCSASGSWPGVPCRRSAGVRGDPS
jgi:hypothetical protein